MAEDQWLLKEDGYLNVDCEANKIIYHPNLNIIIVFSNHNSQIKILDVNSGVVLQSVSITDDNRPVNGKYLSEHDKILFWDEKRLGLRGDYNGVLLLDTILQTPVSHTEELVKIEMLLSEAVLFLQSLQSLEQQGVENSTDVINELTLKIFEAHSKLKKGIKAQKWETVCLELPHSSLKVVASSMVIELKRLQRHIPALAIASAVNERLTDLIVGARIIENDTTQRFHMFSEAARRKSFDQWPHMDYKWALPDQMAQAGFFHQPSDSGDDRAMCFTCNVCLVCWEKTDEPWSEHERHSPECPFVKGEYTQNVPLSVTYATAPANNLNLKGVPIMSTGDQANIVCIGSTEDGEISVWNVERQLKNCATFNIKLCEKDIVKKFDLEQDIDLELTALCTFKKHTVLIKSSSATKLNKFGVSEKGTEVFGTRIIAGVKIKNRDSAVKTPALTGTSMPVFQQDGDSKLALVLYAVTEVAKTAKTNMSTANGNNTSMISNSSNLANKDSLASISISNLLSNPLDTIEERLEDDFLKIFDNNDNGSTPKNKTIGDAMKADYLYNVKKKLQIGIGKFDTPPPTALSQTSGASAVDENDYVICTPIQTISIVPFMFEDYEISEMLPSFDNRYLLIVLKRTGSRNETANQLNSNSGNCSMETEENNIYSKVVDDDNRNVQLILYKIEDNGLINEVPISVRILEEKDTPIEICMLPKFDTSGRLFSGSPTDSEKGVFVITSIDGSLKILSLTTLKTLSEARVEGQKFISSVYCKNLERLCGCTDKGSLHFYSFYDLDIDSSDEYDEDGGNLNEAFTAQNNEPMCIDQQVKASISANVKDEFTQFDNATPSTSSNFTKKEEEKRTNSELIAYKKQLNINDLKTLYSLTLFDEMLTPYSAEVPGCWSELVQAQKQRRNPQHLRPGDDTHLTRTWRLHNDATTWDEHLIELSLPKTTSLGHIDFKFSLYQPCTNPPAIQVTLLKQKSIGLCCRHKSPHNFKQTSNPSNSASNCDVDDNVDFNINASSSSANNIPYSSIENPVLSEEYLQARNAEILAGPIELSSCMGLDLSEQGGLLTLVSPKLLKSKARNYLLHIKTMADLSKEGHNKTRVPVRKKGLTSILLTSFASSSVKEAGKDRVTYSQDANSNKSNSNDFYIGCDWLHEISITVRATREVPNLPNERLQRLAMLESNLLIKNLLEIAKNNEQPLSQNLALDILIWILTIRLSRYRCPRNAFHGKYSNKQMDTVGDIAASDVNLQQTECVELMKNSLNDLIRFCIILNNRSVAHKCVKLIIISLNGAQNMMDQNQSVAFDVALKNSVLESIPHMVNSNYAGSLRWFSTLIAGTSTIESQGAISSSLAQLLIEVLNEVSNRPNPMNSLLQARFGLYLTPFESELFDSDLTAINKNNFPLAYASVLKSNGSGSQQQNLSDLKSFCVQDGSGLRIPIQLRRKTISAHFKGLLEVEPIHYTCCSTSEATRIENMDSISIQSANIIDDILIEAPSNPSINKLGTGVIKIPNDKDIQKNETELDKLNIGIAHNVKNILVDKIFYSHFKKHKLKDFEDKLMASVKSEEKGLANLGLSTFSTDDSTSDSGWGPSSGGMLIYGSEGTRNADDGSDDLFDTSKVGLASVESFSNKVKDFIEQVNKEDNNTILPWHKLLSAPPKQMIVVDRMHSGARRQVTLDFGYPILLTDVIFPSCTDLASLTLDIWCFEEETDSVRLAVSQDIGMKYLILSDLQPPPVCRYVKVTFTGRYGMSATRCKIPMGSFFGHAIILDKESYADPVMKYIKNKKNYIKNQLKVLNALYEDTHCRYCLSSSKLQELLHPLLKSESSNMAHMQSYLNRMKDSDDQCAEFNKIYSVYEECIALQNQLNIVKNVIKRLELVSLPAQPQPAEIPLNAKIKLLCTDKLRVLSECLVESLLHFIINYGVETVNSMYSFFDLKTCNLLFKTLVVRGDSHLQLATCSLLVRMCCFQPWWGEFFANTFTTLFSSQNCEIFPQDRVFFLLTYLGRKSIYMGTCRTVVIDAILKTIASLLLPLSSVYDSRLGIWRNTDLILLSWLLLFLSVCLHDNGEKKENNNPRWDFMSGEADMVKARLSMNSNNSRTFSRSFKKRFLQNKQSSNNIAEKFYMMSDGSFTSAQNSLAQIEQQMKQEVKKYQNSIKMLPYEYLELGKNNKKSDSSSKNGGSNSSNTLNGHSSKSDISCENNLPDSAFDKGLKSIKTQNMLVVIRGLIGLLLNMDFTCNMDLFLLTCKIIARLVNACPSVSLSSIMTSNQLLQLIRIAVWENQQHAWTVHAITCLIQDILEADKNSKISGTSSPEENVSMDVDINPAVDVEMQRSNEFSGVTQNPMQNVINKYTEAVKFQLPSLMECEDAEMEDILDDILEQAKKYTSTSKKDQYTVTNAPVKNNLTVVVRSRVSSTMDARLEYGLDTNIEMLLRRQTLKLSINLFASLPQVGNKDIVCGIHEIPAWPDNILNAWSGSDYQRSLDTNRMLMDVFENIFMDLHLEDSWMNLEQVLQLWLSLNGEIIDSSGNCNFDSGKFPKIPFGEKAIYGLLKALASHPSIQIRGWCLGFQCLIYATKPIADADAEFLQTYYGNCESYMRKICSLIVENDNFERMLLRFLSENDKNNSLNTNRYAGPTICRLMIQLLSQIERHSNASIKLKEITLRVLLHLIQYDGSITKQQGPIDAQSKFIIEILKYNFLKTDLSIAMNIIESVSHLVYNHITNDEKISCQKSSESSNTTNNVFGSLFATVLGSENSQTKTVTDTTLLINLLKLSSILVHTKVPQINDESNNSSIETSGEMSSLNESQTDEIKAEQQSNEPTANPRPNITFADQVLQHYSTMSKLLGTLSQCSNSSFAMFVISSMYSPLNNESKNTLSDPQNVADALFQLLIYLNKLASEPVLVIRPLFTYLNFVCNARHAMPRLQLSEPFLWFILKVLESPYAVEIFCKMGGIKILSENLVRSNRTLVNMQPNLVTMIMQHLSKSQNVQSLSVSSKKTVAPSASTSSPKNEEGLINFAPYCSISSENPSAQPADVLIQGPVPSHRRARTPAWSYLFYPHESHVDLTITLPTAVLLKEIQLQPHLSTLASCPSAVAIEVTRDPNLGPIPITQPIYTIGMTCIRLKFTQPEIATHIIIRLYRPKDSASIGLTQISVLGTTIFNDIANLKNGAGPNVSYNNSNEDIEDDSLTRTSLGWLRILAQCFNAATYDVDQNLSNMVISSASEVNGFLEACCSLLNIAPSTPNFSLQNLETVLIKLGLYNKELGLKLINILLNESIPQMYKICNESISDLLYQLCTTNDSFSRDRIQFLLNWLQNLRCDTDRYSTTKQIINPNSGYIKCLASILWQAYATNLIVDLPSMITLDLFEILYNWLTEVPDKSPIKVAIDSIMCSICCIRPEFFNMLLKKMGALVPNTTTEARACISSDRKYSSEFMTDDNKQEECKSGDWYVNYTLQSLNKLDLSESQLDTISMACQSPLAIYQFIDTGLPNLFTSAILEFCHRMSNKDLTVQDLDDDQCLTDIDKANINSSYPMVNIIKITKILDFLTQICSEGHMRDWLGSYEGSVFWEPLLTLLCNNKLQNVFMEDQTTNQPYIELEETVIKFLSNVTSCHPKNQDTLTTNLISVIRTTERNNYNININNVLNKNFDSMSNTYSSPLNMKYSISGFTRRLVLQILLESEKIPISVRSDLPLQKKDTNIVLISNHPSKKVNSHHLLFYVSINTRCQDILENCVSIYNNLIPSMNCDNSRPSDIMSSNSDSTRSDHRKEKDLWDWGLGMNLGMEFLSVAAGVTAKDKRSKDVKNQANSLKTKDLFSVFKLKPDEVKNLSSLPECAQLVHPVCPEILITSDTTISQILAMVKTAGLSLSTPCINLNLIQSKNIQDDISYDGSMKASDFVPLPSPLQIFSSRGGLSLLAHYLPTVYPEQPKNQQKLPEKDKTTPVGEWVKIEPNDEIYEDVDDSLADSSSKMPVISSVPQHSLAAFGLFLKLPAYSEVLLRDKVRAQCLLRLILGVTGDGEGNDIYSLAFSSSLPTLPFEVFRQLLDSSPLTTDDGILLRRMVVEVGAVHLVLNCLSIFTHQNPNVLPEIQTSNTIKANGNGATGEEATVSDDKSHVYWAKGTGFGTGSTQQSWNVEQALMRQKSEEEHVTVLLQVLSSYINPGDTIPSQCETSDNINYREPNEISNAELPALFLELLQSSCLIPALCSYLRNDSVLDITRHIPLYRAILQLLRALSLSNQLVQLLMKQDSDGKTSIATLLYNMKTCVDTYASRLKINKKSNLKGQTHKVSISLDDSDDEGLALLIPDIQETASLVQSATYTESLTKDDSQQNANSVDYPMSSSIEQKYLEIMKKLQFDTFEMIVESENGYRFTVSHHFETNVRMSGDRGHPARVKRLAQEAVTLSTSLPLSYSSSVFVRCDTDRLDVMKVLITGPADTPYANGCFEFDVYFPHDYPNSPMMINLETTGRHSVRFNPNLYNDGKVCLSVLNTWHGRPEEKWNSQTSSFLQVLVSIQSLILVPEPYFNEPGFERSRGTPSGTHSSREYNSNIYQACVKWAMLEQLKNPSPCFKDVIYTHFWLKRNEICQQIENWIAELSRPQYSERGGRTITFNSMVLRRQYRQLREELAKLPVPDGIDFDQPFSANVTTSPNPTSSVSAQPANTIESDGNLLPTTSSDLEFDISGPKSDIDKDLEVVELPTDTPSSPDKHELNEALKSSLKSLNDYMSAEMKMLETKIQEIEDASSDTDEFLQMNESTLDNLIDDVIKTHKNIDNMVEDISE